VGCAVVTISDTRTWDTDTGGQDLARRLVEAGHAVISRQIVPDDPSQLGPLLVSLCGQTGIDAVLMTGGTGVSSRDQTYETVTNLLTKPIPGYGELFRMLSFAVIGPAAILSRATGGLLNRTVVLTMPGSPAAISLAMEKIILPELAHLVREARR
jgi:molybdenum cofactor biosynthesis protein B